MSYPCPRFHFVEAWSFRALSERQTAVQDWGELRGKYWTYVLIINVPVLRKRPPGVQTLYMLSVSCGHPYFLTSILCPRSSPLSEYLLPLLSAFRLTFRKPLSILSNWVISYVWLIEINWPEVSLLWSIHSCPLLLCFHLGTSGVVGLAESKYSKSHGEVVDEPWAPEGKCCWKWVVALTLSSLWLASY